MQIMVSVKLFFDLASIYIILLPNIANIADIWSHSLRPILSPINRMSIHIGPLSRTVELTIQSILSPS